MTTFQEPAPELPTGEKPLDQGHPDRFANGIALTQEVALPFHLPTPAYGAMLAIWHFRAALQKRFPLHKGRSRDFIRFLAWCTYFGRRRFKLLRQIPEWDLALSKPIDLPQLRQDRWQDTWSVGQFLFALGQYHYVVGPILRSHKVRDKLASAYWRKGRHEAYMPEPAAWQAASLCRNFGGLEGLRAVLSAENNALAVADPGAGTPGLVLDDLDCDSQTGTRRETENFDGYPMLQLQASPSGTLLDVPESAVQFYSLAQAGFSLAMPRLNEFELSAVTGRVSLDRRPRAPTELPFGVNLFGYAKGEIGIGEDVRLVAKSLAANGIPVCIIDVKAGANVSQLDTSAERWISDKPVYAINLFCVTGMEHSRFACENGLDVFSGRYTIGMWPWELPKWPNSCHHAYAVVDEIWGISRYTAGAYTGAGRKVIPMSLPVTVDEVDDLTRGDLGLPDAAYLFVFAFDFNSTLIRKNPSGVLDAFLQAFPDASDSSVGLVIKASHVNPGNREWKRIKRRAAKDRRIRLFEETLRRPQVLALYRACDCFVSLHRAEGFGRSIAEALLLDRQVIATGYSGNLDFCHPDRVALVTHRMRPVRKGEYFFADEQYWAEPDIAHAAALMRDIRENPRPLQPKQYDFSLQSIGRRYAQRLHEIRAELIQNEGAIG